MRSCCRLAILVAFLLASRASGELIYAAAGTTQGWQLFWFDSEAPSTPLGSLNLFGAVDEYIQFRIEFDPWTHELYTFGYPNCQITCPPSPIYPARVDLESGETTFLEWPEFPSFLMSLHDIRIDPQTREVRAIGHQRRNFRYSLSSMELFEDTALDTPGWYVAVAHTPIGGENGGETLALWHQGSGILPGRLARIGGVGGNPPASTGQVTLSNEIEGPHWIQGLDISTAGTVFLLGVQESFGPHHLYRLDPETLESHDLGVIIPPAGSGFVAGHAAAPPGLGQGVVEVPALSNFALAAMAIVLSLVALAMRRSSHTAT